MENIKKRRISGDEANLFENPQKRAKYESNIEYEIKNDVVMEVEVSTSNHCSSLINRKSEIGNRLGVENFIMPRNDCKCIKSTNLSKSSNQQSILSWIKSTIKNKLNTKNQNSLQHKSIQDNPQKSSSLLSSENELNKISNENKLDKILIENKLDKISNENELKKFATENKLNKISYENELNNVSTENESNKILIETKSNNLSDEKEVNKISNVNELNNASTENELVKISNESNKISTELDILSDDNKVNKIQNENELKNSSNEIKLNVITNENELKNATKENDLNEITNENELSNLSAQNCTVNKSGNSSIALNSSSANLTSFLTKSSNELSIDLSLPDKYLKLIQMFEHLEIAITIMYNRQETCTFEKAKLAVQKMIKKEFSLKHLGQIVTIYPSAYKLSYDKLPNVDNLKNRKIYHLIIKPNVISTKIIPYTIQIRRNEFKDSLYRFAKREHLDYLLSLDEPIILKSQQLMRWHPSFIFPNIPEAKLPEEPTDSSTKSFNEFWSRVNLKDKNESSTVNSSKRNDKSDQLKVKTGILKGLSQSFVDKVRNKALLNMQLVKYRDPEIEKKIMKIKKLHEFIRKLQSLFFVEKKRVISLESLIEKLTIGIQKLYSTNECAELIGLINEYLPDWLLVLKTRRGTFIKINTEVVLKSLHDRIDRVVIKLEKKY